MRRRWTAGIVITLVFHLGLILLLHVEAGQTIRAAGTNPRVVWVGDKTLMEEGTMREQVMRILDPAPLFLPTTLNYAGARTGDGGDGSAGRDFPPLPTR
jgi:hypothetical protein